MPRSTQNSQATPLVEVEADANRPSSCDVAGASASNASPPGDANASAATNPPSQPSPEFLATVVQAVKAALAACLKTQMAYALDTWLVMPGHCREILA